MTDARLIAIDWGTSNARASLLGAGGERLAERSATTGIMAVQEGRFAQALQALCGPWLEQGAVPLIACGMIGSRQGWREAPYVDCPARLKAVAALLTVVDTGLAGRKLNIVPGLRWRGASGQWDVMRGEETQVWGVGAADSSLCVLPGTHSKWVWREPDGRIDRFRTYMTGELYAVLCQHSILGRLMKPGPYREDAFLAGARRGRENPADATHLLFSVRTAGLMGSLNADCLADYLSGLLIGIEMASALELFNRGSGAGCQPQICFIGEKSLCARYVSALDAVGTSDWQAVVEPGLEASEQGLWNIASAAGLLR